MSKKKQLEDLGVVQIAVRHRESHNLVHVLVFKHMSKKHIADFYVPAKLLSTGNCSSLMQAVKNRAKDVGITWQYEHFHSMNEIGFNKLLQDLD